MTFLYPSYLWALLGLAVPLAIHLWSKKDGKTIQIGSIQLLTESFPKQASSIQINELLLLFLRLLIIVLLAFILAAPQWHERTEKQSIMYVIEPQLLKHREIREMLDSIPEAQIRLLQGDFPQWERGDSLEINAPAPAYWQLAQHMQNLPADSLVVYSRALIQGIHGKRPAINKKINWISLNADVFEDQPVLALGKKDSLQLITVNSTNRQFTFNKEKPFLNSGTTSKNADSISITRGGKMQHLPFQKVDTLTVQIAASDTLQTEKKYLTAALRALSSYLDQPMKIMQLDKKAPANDRGNLLIWLKNGPIPAFSGRILTYKSDFFAQKLVVPTENPAVFQLTASLNSENIISRQLPENLLPFLNLNPDLQEKTVDYDIRSLSKSELETSYNAAATDQKYARTADVSPWLWLALLLVLLTERITAYYKKQ